MLKKIPRLKLETELLLAQADRKNFLYTYSSDLRGVGYVTDGEEILVITTKGGYLRIGTKEMKTMLEELNCVIEDNERFRSAR